VLPTPTSSSASESGVTLIELLIGLAISIAAMGIAVSQMGNISMFFSSARAEATARTEVSQAIDQFKIYFQSKWKGGAFECGAAPVIGNDSYCVRSGDCLDQNPSGFQKCRSIAIIRGDPADASTKPDRIRVTTQCRAATGDRQKSLLFQNSVCGLSCAAGSYPVATMDITRADGRSRTFTYPAGVAAGKEVSSSAEMRGLELCLTKIAGSGLVTIDAQGYYLYGNELKSVRKQASVAELTSTNPNIEFLP